MRNRNLRACITLGLYGLIFGIMSNVGLCQVTTDGLDQYRTPKGPSGHLIAEHNFYDFKCNADTYTPALGSFSSIWALFNTLVVIVATVIFLLFVCFNKFVSAMIQN
ncbi:envelope glycoprotein N [Common bottlenose dolphin gammaherpesvirus 1 strain Sarasota]|uniref:Envelope glycoprotein N n=1 Tax=Common bottlenose dolphin gammaherpesvirus 1 strain Sarasota TaxID=2022783 RepID=A0A1Z1NEJ2_9GAMA|nr:envelope glycoprotein N [Common bottlenose dolphin gammaherpesvirus 1 strain Sarasota]ARW78115.1 envelope glycoprotein N [Common bottlenose dolphin gammaherpesvirus 1 strain Sarasota]